MTSIPKTPIPDTRKDDVSTPRDQATWLLTRIDSSIDYVRRIRARFQRWAGSIRVVTLLLSGVVTVALGIRWSEYSDTLRNIAFVVGALSTTLASLDLYFSYRGLWIEHEEAEWRLHRLKDRVGFYLEGRTDEQLNASTITEFHESYQWIWDNLSTKWLSLRRSSNDN
jgi:hypothetical protein